VSEHARHHEDQAPGVWEKMDEVSFSCETWFIFQPVRISEKEVSLAAIQLKT
jgi:hypothetical protein